MAPRTARGPVAQGAADFKAGERMVNPAELPKERDHVRAITSLSDRLHAPVDAVDAIYRHEYDRLAQAARIPTYLVVLAMNKTRSILRRAETHPGHG
jgi:hypothetical protein